MTLVARALLVVVVAWSAAGCERAPVTLWVDGFVPEHVSYDVRDLGVLDDNALRALRETREIDGVLRLPADACPGVCRASEVSIYVQNRTAQPIAPPVVRLDAPPGRASRLPLAVRSAQIDPGRTGRLRFIVQRWPEENALSATLSSSVALEVTAPPAPPPPALPPAKERVTTAP